MLQFYKCFLLFRIETEAAKKVNFAGVRPVYTSKFSLFANERPVYTNNFYLKTKDGDWDLWMTQKEISNFMCCLVYTDNFLYVAIFICHIKTSTPVFKQMSIVT